VLLLVLLLLLLLLLAWFGWLWVTNCSTAHQNGGGPASRQAEVRCA
jgi:hypothetical protein